MVLVSRFRLSASWSVTCQKSFSSGRPLGRQSSAALLFSALSAQPRQIAKVWRGKNFENVTISTATSIAPPFNIAGKDPPTPVSVNRPFCRVEGVLRPSADSDIKFEVWLPPESAWNGKYQAIGNGGFAGSLIYRSMDRSLEVGYAVSGTDTGHSGRPLDATWALGHPEKIVAVVRISGDRTFLGTGRPQRSHRLCLRGAASVRLLGCSQLPQNLDHRNQSTGDTARARCASAAVLNVSPVWH
jgi:Tannase and feruloyl esterase